MSEADRNPAIRIHIDQQVFIDAVLGHEEVEDATVVTEVVGFDRNDTHYVLDGALVFTGYIRQSDDELEITAEDLQGDIGSAVTEEDATVQQIHCRMPFTLEVPVTAQRNEFLNVMARVGTWNIATLGPKWLHVRAELVVNGLTGEEGYRFRCGTQEEGFPSLPAQDAFSNRAYEHSQESQDVQEAQELQGTPNPFEASQFPFGSPWQNDPLIKQTPLEGTYPFQAPFTTPYVTPSQPISWDRKWPEPIGSSTRQSEQEDVQQVVEQDHSHAAFDSVDQDVHSYMEADRSEDHEGVGTDDVSLLETRYSFENEYDAAEQQKVDTTEYEDTALETQAERVEHEVADEVESTQVSSIEYVEPAVEQHVGQNEMEQEEAVYHFEDVAESSALHQEPVFQLKIQGKHVKESSTFGAMSTLMDAAQSVRDESVAAPLEPSANKELVSAGRESSSYVVKDRPEQSNQQVDYVSTHVEANPESDNLENDLDSPILVATDEAFSSIPVKASEEVPVKRPVEETQDIILEADVKGAEDPVAASVTIAERKQLQEESDHVFLWTELYPFLEETFHPLKYRIVQEEDTVDRIAETYRIQTADLMRANHMQTEQIDIGQMLYIPIRKR